MQFNTMQQYAAKKPQEPKSSMSWKWQCSIPKSALTSITNKQGMYGKEISGRAGGKAWKIHGISRDFSDERIPQKKFYKHIPKFLEYPCLANIIEFH